MAIIIAFMGGMLTLLSPCTLPVIPFLFASVRGQKRHLAAMLTGMVLMFTLVSSLAGAVVFECGCRLAYLPASGSMAGKPGGAPGESGQ